MLAKNNTEEVKGGNGGYLDTAKRAQHGQGELAGELADDAEVRGARLLASLWCVEVVDEMNVGTESWVASMRPSADDLNAGAAFIDSDELEANANMLRFIGELSVSQMLGENTSWHKCRYRCGVDVRRGEHQSAQHSDGGRGRRRTP